MKRVVAPGRDGWVVIAVLVVFHLCLLRMFVSSCVCTSVTRVCMFYLSAYFCISDDFRACCRFQLTIAHKRPEHRAWLTL